MSIRDISPPIKRSNPFVNFENKKPSPRVSKSSLESFERKKKE